MENLWKTLEKRCKTGHKTICLTHWPLLQVAKCIATIKPDISLLIVP